MSRFILLGLSNDSLPIQALFRDIADQKIPNARYFCFPVVFEHKLRVLRFLTGRKLKRLMERHTVIQRLFGPIAKAAAKLPRPIDLRRLRPLLSDAEENYLILCVGIGYEWVNPRLVKTLKDDPLCHHVIFYLIDSVADNAVAYGRSMDDLLALFRMFDNVFTYNAADAEQFSDCVQYIDIPLWTTNPPPMRIAPPSADLYFCGRNKNRRDLVASISDRLARAGMKCSCLLADRENPEASPDRWVPYEDTLRGLFDANCVLEVLTKTNAAPTLRFKEAVVYNKKLLTNNPNISALPYYDPRWMRTFQTAEDIDLDWLHAVEPVDYGYQGDYSAQTFLNRVEELAARSKR